MIILDGKKTANDIKQEIAIKVAELVNTGDKKPHLAAILVGSDVFFLSISIAAGIPVFLALMLIISFIPVQVFLISPAFSVKYFW